MSDSTETDTPPTGPAATVTPQPIGPLTYIIAERARQRQKWGDEHDQWHTPAEWVGLLAAYLGKAALAAVNGSADEYHRRIVQLGALTIAALEAARARERRSAEGIQP